VMVCLRLAALPAASQDDAEQLLFAQAVAGGYSTSHPPLSTWLVVLVQGVLGPGVAAVAVVKFASLFALYAFLFLAGRQMLTDRRLAALAALSPVGLYYVGWDAILNYSNTVLMAAACAATFYALVRALRSGGALAFAGLGAAIGVGLLAKYGYALFVAALLLACLSQAHARARLVRPGALLAVAVAALVMLPHGLWLAGHWPEISAGIAARYEVDAGASYLSGAANGLLKLANAVVWFLFPLILVFPVFFAGAVRRIPTDDEDRAALRTLLARFFVIAVVLVAAGILVFGITTVRTHYMFILLLAPLYAFLRVDAHGAGMAARSGYAASLAVLALTAMIGIGIKGAADPAWCRKCYFHVPYPALAGEMRAAGFKRGTIVLHFHRYQMGGNLRTQFPAARVLSTKYPWFAPPRRTAEAGQCLLVWEVEAGETPPHSLVDFVEQRLAIAVRPDTVPRFAEANLIGSSEHPFRIGYLLLAGGPGECR